MTEENYRDRKKGIFSWVFGEGEDGERTEIYSPEEVDVEEYEEPGKSYSGGFTVERAAGVIKGLPSDVPHASAVRIVRQTMSAAGIDIEDLQRSSGKREAKLNSEIGLSQRRMDDLKEKTQEYVSSLEEKIRKAKQDRDSGVSKEEQKISRARSGLSDVELVRDFFELPGVKQGRDDRQSREAEPRPETRNRPAAQPDEGSPDDTDGMEPVRGVDDATQVIRRTGPLARDQESRRDRNGSGGNRDR